MYYVVSYFVQDTFGLFVQYALPQSIECVAMLRLQYVVVFCNEIVYLIQWQVEEQTLSSCIYDGYLFLDRIGFVLRLHEQGGVFASFVESTLRNRVHIAAKLGERLQFAILSLVGFQSTCNLFHRLYLSVTAHTRYRYTHVDGRADTCIEKTCLEEYLSVGKGDNVSGDICRYVARLCLDYRQSRQRAAALDFVFEHLGQVVHLACHIVVGYYLGSSLEQT